MNCIQVALIAQKNSVVRYLQKIHFLKIKITFIKKNPTIFLKSLSYQLSTLDQNSRLKSFTILTALALCQFEMEWPKEDVMYITHTSAHLGGKKGGGGLIFSQSFFTVLFYKNTFFQVHKKRIQRLLLAIYRFKLLIIDISTKLALKI